jgi:hypothetical protein
LGTRLRSPDSEASRENRSAEIHLFQFGSMSMSQKITLLLLFLVGIAMSATQTASADVQGGFYEIGALTAYGDTYPDATDELENSLSIIAANLPNGDSIVGVGITEVIYDANGCTIEYYVFVSSGGPPGP